jgi:hypothetical protein
MQNKKPPEFCDEKRTDLSQGIRVVIYFHGEAERVALRRLHGRDNARIISPAMVICIPNQA